MADCTTVTTTPMFNRGTALMYNEHTSAVGELNVVNQTGLLGR